MIKTCIIGASGYTGAELAAIVHRHNQFELAALFVSNCESKSGRETLSKGVRSKIWRGTFLESIVIISDILEWSYMAVVNIVPFIVIKLVTSIAYNY